MRMTRHAFCVLAASLSKDKCRLLLRRNPAYGRPSSLYFATAVEPAPTIGGTGTTRDADCVRIVHMFLEEVGVFSSTGGVMSILEMRADVRGRCAC